MPLTKKEERTVNILMFILLVTVFLRFLLNESANLETVLDIVQILIIVAALFVSKPWRTYLED